VSRMASQVDAPVGAQGLPCSFGVGLAAEDHAKHEQHAPDAKAKPGRDKDQEVAIHRIAMIATICPRRSEDSTSARP
jgi:hypothetical protein